MRLKSCYLVSRRPVRRSPRLTNPTLPGGIQEGLNRNAQSSVALETYNDFNFGSGVGGSFRKYLTYMHVRWISLLALS
jgi:hypothetical protein